MSRALAASQIGTFRAFRRFYFTTRQPAVESKARTIRAPLSESPSASLLGTAEQDKRHVILDCGHAPWPFQDVIKEVVPWLDRYLGPVQTEGKQ